MSFDLTPVAFVGGAAVVLLLGWAVLRSRADAAKSLADLAALSFVPCSEDGPGVRSLVQDLRGEPGAEVRDVYRYDTGDRAVYRYHVHIDRADAPIDAEEFLFACKTLAARRFALFLRPASLPDGHVTRMLGALLAKVAGIAPSGVGPIEVPAQLRSKLLAALGPSGRSLYDSIDDRTLTLLLSSASRGFIAIRVAGGYCAMELISAWGRNALPDFDWRKAAGAALETASRLA